MASENAGGPSVLTTPEDTEGGVRVYADKTASIQGRAYTWERVVTTKAVEISDSGTVFLLALAGGFTVTMPTLAQVLAMEKGGGFWCKFIVAIAPTTAYIITEDGGADTDKVIGTMAEGEINTNADADYSGGATFVNFVASQAAIGDWVEYFSDGLQWYIHGHANLTAGATIT